MHSFTGRRQLQQQVYFQHQFNTCLLKSVLFVFGTTSGRTVRQVIGKIKLFSFDISIFQQFTLVYTQNRIQVIQPAKLKALVHFTSSAFNFVVVIFHMFNHFVLLYLIHVSIYIIYMSILTFHNILQSSVKRGTDLEPPCTSPTVKSPKLMPGMLAGNVLNCNYHNQSYILSHSQLQQQVYFQHQFNTCLLRNLFYLYQGRRDGRTVRQVIGKIKLMWTWSFNAT